MYRIYTDGACKRNGRAGAAASYSYVFPDHPDESYAERVPVEQSQTNNTAELLSIKYALEKAKRKGARTIQLYTDSEFARSCICVWPQTKWFKNGWKTDAGKPVVHRTIIEQILELLKSFESYTITHVRAHTGGSDEHSRWNDVADRMAVKALEQEDPVKYEDLAPVQNPVPASQRPPPIEGCPLTLMGGLVGEDQLMTYMRNNIDKLYAANTKAVQAGLLSALKKIYTDAGYEIEKQTVHKRAVYRIAEKNHLIVERLHNTTQDE